MSIMKHMTATPDVRSTPVTHTVQTSCDAQAARRVAVQTLHREDWFDRFDGTGAYVDRPTDDFRQRMWHAMSFLNGKAKHIARANAMLGHLLPLKPDHFWSSGVTSILARFGDKLDENLRTALQDKLAQALPTESMQTFRGYNDNYPAMAALSAIIGGELTGQPEVVAGGLRNLESLKALLTRRGFLTEYASPTYSAITLTCLAEIVELTQNQRARALALAGEQRVWWEICSRFHAPTSSLAGPHSRAYMIDMLANAHNIHVSLYQALGDAVFINPVTAMFPPIRGQALHGGVGLPTAHAAWQTTPTYHLPDAAARYALDKPLPCTVEADCEQAAFSRNVWSSDRHPQTPLAEFQAGESHLVTYFTEDYALGTSSRPSMDGYQHTAAHLVPRRREATSLCDISTLFTRYLIGESTIDRHQHLGEQGRTISVQHEGTAMMLAWPKPGWGANQVGVDATREPVASLRLSVLLPCFWSRPNAVFLGDEPCAGCHGRSVSPVSVYIHDGPVYVALHPLFVDDLGRSQAVRIAEHDEIGVISFVNYEGSPKTFSYTDLVTTRNGIVIEVDQASRWESFDAFRRHHASPAITDQWYAADAMRLVRYARPGLSLEMAVSPVSEGIKYRSVNGQQARAPKLVLPGADRQAIPWLDA